jgi:hypothetical protein
MMEKGYERSLKAKRFAEKADPQKPLKKWLKKIA